jgi:hypothetical protein
VIRTILLFNIQQLNIQFSSRCPGLAVPDYYSIAFGNPLLYGLAVPDYYSIAFGNSYAAAKAFRFYYQPHLTFRSISAVPVKKTESRSGSGFLLKLTIQSYFRKS